MDNKKLNITELIQKYERMRYINKTLYFDADEFVMIANHYKRKKEASEAERVVNLGLGIHPHSSELMITKAKILLAAESYEAAHDYLLTIPEDETNVDLLLVKFECLLNLGKIREANAFLDYILKGDLDEEKFFKFITEVGYLYNEAERYETAIMLLEKAKEIDDTNVEVLEELSYAYEWSDNIDKAIEITNTIIDINPYSFSAWVNLGMLFSYNWEYEKSIEAFDFALAIKDGAVHVLQLKALSYNQDDNYEEELRLLNECIEASPNDESLYDDLIKRYEELEEYWGLDNHEKVLKLLEEKAERFGPKDVLLKMAHLYLYWDKTEEAREIYKRIPEEDKNTIKYYTLQGELAMRDEDDAAAEKAFMLAYQESPVDLEVLDRLAVIHEDNDNREKAAEYFEQIMAIDPEYEIVKFRLAFIRFQIGEKEPFIDLLNQIDDEQLRMLFGMFNTFAGKEKIDEATLSREELIQKSDEAREIWVLKKNSKAKK